jgi:threonine/homoserine/homoserine lactone efflux protein
MLSSLYWLGFALAASPGPDFFLIMRNSLNGGRFMGYVTLAGNRLSLCLHMAFAILGLSIILQQSNALFVAVRLLGAAYLTYLGARNLWERFRGARRAAVAPAAGAPTPVLAFRSGFLNNLLNPNVSLFFLSLFPQFASPDLLAHSPLTVAGVFFAGNTSWWVPLVFVAGMARLRAGVLRFQHGLDIVFGILFIGYGLQVAAEFVL